MAAFDVRVMKESLCMARLILLTYGKCLSFMLSGIYRGDWIANVFAALLSSYLRKSLNPWDFPLDEDGLAIISISLGALIRRFFFLGSYKIYRMCLSMEWLLEKISS